MAIATNYFPESYFPGFSYFPAFLKPQQISYYLDEVTIELDSTGKYSIIHLIDKDGNKISPYFDLDKYDSEVKDWYWYDIIDNLPYRESNNLMVNLYPTSIGNAIYDHKGPLKYNNVSGVVEGTFLLSHYHSYTFIKYMPLTIVGNNVLFTDTSDYLNFTDTNNLDQVTPTPHFYYDFKDRIFTNVNLASYDTKSFKIIMYSVGAKGLTPVALKCVMGSSFAGQSKTTPVVKDYILKLKGQYLGS